VSLSLEGVPEPMASAAAPEELAPGRVEARTQTPEMKSPPAGPVVRRLGITQLTRDKMRYAVALMSYQRGSRDDAELVDRAFDALIEKLEKQKFCVMRRLRRGEPRRTRSRRHITAEVRSRVLVRDGDR